MKNNLEHDWDDYSKETVLDKFKYHLLAGVVVIGLGVYAVGKFTSVDFYDANVSMLEGDYKKAINISKQVLATTQDPNEEIQSKQLLIDIYSDTNKPYLDIELALSLISELHAISPNVKNSELAVQLSKKLGLSIEKYKIYLEFLAKAKNIRATDELIAYYLSKNNTSETRRAVQLLSSQPKSASNQLQLAKIYLDKENGVYKPKDAENILEESARLGSNEANFLLAMMSLERSKKDTKNSAQHISSFIEKLTNAVSLGYIGEDVDSAILTISLGRNYVPRNPALATKLQNILTNNRNKNVK